MINPLDEKEIRGITAKLLKGVMWQTVVGVAMACAIYFQLKSDIKNLYTLRTESERYWQLKFDQIQIQNSILQKQLDEISIRITDLRNRIDTQKITYYPDNK